MVIHIISFNSHLQYTPTSAINACVVRMVEEFCISVWLKTSQGKHPLIQSDMHSVDILRVFDDQIRYFDWQPNVAI